MQVGGTALASFSLAVTATAGADWRTEIERAVLAAC
jgi:hypothetical protein